MANLKGVFLSESPHWRTPKYIMEELKKEFGVLYDPCPIQYIIDGLTTEWRSNTFVNPPYNREIIKWLKKAVIEKEKYNKTIIFLLPARTDTVWFQDYVLPYHKGIRFIRGRLKFNDEKGSAPFPSMIVIF